MGYYDIDDILADSVEIPCKFQHDIPGLGYLENNPGKPISKNAKLDLPIWLARILAIVGGDANPDTMEDEEPLPFVELLTPDMFSPKVINAIKADPASLDLHAINSYFYSLATKWITLFNDKQLAEVVHNLLLERSQIINKYAGSVPVDLFHSSTDIGSGKKTGHSSHGGNSSMVRVSNSTFLLTLDEFEKKIYKKSHESYKDTKRWMFEK
ncbi:DNA replication protein PSF3 NDAI_0G01380 [Naumovozyma dairenensis CBS 421]|uniref:DNA replication complex GINS protein PSF3 n=1 Tax=Naumovozyma dairenensis (strain ATCC 10597 / BCRC 20456 / CBS 421 / NBRC 0211 / NRRL Y-12639) TaxID=1071378 RepID=G0WDQ3_NAUDC|nr:hypothetical protein NDAI_0G01380 [Naumovozyma dairenensis CBS 421]CCD25914.2 hypothetical protein NDAI_0G01380 [Naumovozyma dairenensis CBS 421]